jgi:hypothetical protein
MFYSSKKNFHPRKLRLQWIFEPRLARDSHLQGCGIQVLRTSNEQVFNNPEDLVNSLNKIIEEKSHQISRNISPTPRKSSYYKAPYRQRYPPRRY